MGGTAYIYAPVNCDFCKMEELEVEARYDGKTVHGPWAYMCESHFEVMGIGLGTGRGQKLIVGERPQSDQSDSDIEEYGPDTDSEEAESEPDIPAVERTTDEVKKASEGSKSSLDYLMNRRDLWP